MSQRKKRDAIVVTMSHNPTQDEICPWNSLSSRSFRSNHELDEVTRNGTHVIILAGSLYVNTLETDVKLRY